MKRNITIAILIGIIIIGITLAIVFINRINSDDSIDLGIEKGGPTEYREEILSHFDLKITNFSEIQKIVKLNEEKFYKDIEEYIYKNGLVQATEAKYSDYENNGQFLILSFKLNDDNRTTIYSKINTKYHSYTFFDNYW